MPRGDRTGPMGMGPMSGRAAGRCGGFDIPGCASTGLGRGRGWGFGRGGGGRCWMPWKAAGPSPFDAEAQRQVLMSQADALRAQLGAVESRIEGYEEKEKPASSSTRSTT
jgi:hypothetical protein